MKIKRLLVSSFQTNCYVVYKDKDALIIDPGDQGKKIQRFISENELKVHAILLTHGHLDHIGAVDYLYQIHHCPIYIHQQDMICLSDRRYNLSGRSQPVRVVSPVFKMPETMRIASFNLRYHHLPGHTQGSVMIELMDEKLLFSGDVLFKESIGRFDFFGSSKQDTIETIKKIKLFEGDYIIYPGHDESTTLSYELEHNPYLTML